MVTSPQNHEASFWQEEACAKINLFLHVVGRRRDGYHLLDSLVVFANYADRITLEPSNKDRLDISGDFASLLAVDGQDNLIFKALARLRRIVEIPPLAISLEKNLPVAAGIGGGSSDAAAIIRLIMCCFELKITPDDLRMITTELGADVPACLEQRPQRMQGIGEMLSAVTLPAAPLWLVLVNPGVMLSTKSIFASLNLEAASVPLGSFLPDASESWESWCDWLGRMTRNDLEGAAIAQAPAIAACLQLLAQQPGCLLARMSGSGASCFGAFNEKNQAHMAATAIQKQLQPKAWVKLCCMK